MAELELADVDHAVVLRHADQVGEVAQRLGSDAAAAHAGDGGHAGVVPARDPLLVHDLQELPLRHHRVAEGQPGELVLAGARVPRAGVVEHPVVELAVRLELERADRVGHPLDGVLERVGLVVHRVDAPGVAGAVVVRVADPVEERIPHDHVGVRHVDARAQHRGAVRELARPHAAQEVEVLRGGPVAERARDARALEAAPLLPDGLLRLAVDVGLAVPHQPLGAVVHLLEVVGGEVEVLAPVATQPADVVLDRLDVFGVLGGGVGVVEAEVGAPPVPGGQAEVEQDRLGVADVEEAVRLRREAGDDRTLHPARGQVGIDDVGEEVPGARRFGHPWACTAAPDRSQLRERRVSFAAHGGPPRRVEPPPLARGRRAGRVGRADRLDGRARRLRARRGPDQLRAAHRREGGGGRGCYTPAFGLAGVVGAVVFVLRAR